MPFTTWVFLRRIGYQPSDRIKPRQCGKAAIFALGLLTLQGCGEKGPPVGTVGHVEGFAGAVVADEPRAVLVARDALSAGGNAVDAAVAMYFTLAVTLPSQAGLGGGGVCLVQDHKAKKTEALEFLAPLSQVQPSAKNVHPRPSAVPMAARGMAVLHGRYGRLRWEGLLTPAENLARFGNPVSRAFAADLALAGPALLEDSEARRLFARADGSPLREGDILTQLELAALISRVRQRGVGEMHLGQAAQNLAAAYTEAGGSLSVEDLRNAIPRWRETLKVKTSLETMHFPPLPSGGGFGAEIWSLLTMDRAYARANADEKAHVLAEAFARAFADRANWLRPDGQISISAVDLLSDARLKRLMAGYDSGRHAALPASAPFPVENPSGTGFAVFDKEGNAVVCSVGMYNLFGAGRIAPGTGVLLAAAPDRAGRGPIAVSPMLSVNHNVNEIRFAAAAAGGPTAFTALMQVAARAVLDRAPLAEAQASIRIHHGGQPDVALAEPGAGQDLIESLRRRGYDTAQAPMLGRVNALHCQQGLPPYPQSCEAVVDPRGMGLGLLVGAKQ